MASIKLEIIIPNPIGLGVNTLGEFNLEKIEEAEPKTYRVCPQCHVLPERPAESHYGKCPSCDTVFPTWHKCVQAMKLEEGFVPVGALSTERTKQATVHSVDLEYVKGFFTKGSYAITPRSDTAKGNLQKLAVILASFKKGAIIKVCFRKASREHLLLVTPNPDGYIIASELIPTNLLKSDYTNLLVQMPEIGAVQKEQAEALLKMLPAVTPEDLVVETGYPEGVAQVVENKAQVAKLEDMLAAVMVAETPKRKVKKAA